MNNEGYGTGKSFAGGMPGASFMARRNNLMASNAIQQDDT
jgi:hypothetical protein